MNIKWRTYFLYKAKISSKGQIVIPKKIREQLKLKEGDEVLIYLIEDGIVIKKKKKANLKELRGILADKIVFKEAAKTLEELRREWRL